MIDGTTDAAISEQEVIYLLYLEGRGQKPRGQKPHGQKPRRKKAR